MKIKVKNIYCGKEEELSTKKNKVYKTSYRKKLVDKKETLFINEFGFETDTQSDKEHHGGLDKAVCVYSLEYYFFFKENYSFDLPDCAFGENLTIEKFDDSQICLGDRFKYGEVIFEVSQPRQPCWKISAVLDIKNLTAIVVNEAKTGFYFSVLKSGKITSKDSLELISRSYPNLTIEHINKCMKNARNNQENILEILKCSSLAKAYREVLLKKYYL